MDARFQIHLPSPMGVLLPLPRGGVSFLFPPAIFEADALRSSFLFPLPSKQISTVGLAIVWFGVDPFYPLFPHSFTGSVTFCSSPVPFRRQGSRPVSFFFFLHENSFFPRSTNPLQFAFFHRFFSPSSGLLLFFLILPLERNLINGRRLFHTTLSFHASIPYPHIRPYLPRPFTRFLPN